jgi:hypothetical protein
MAWIGWKRWQRRRKKCRDTRNLIVGLASRDPAQRYASELVLLELGPEGVSLLLSELKAMGNLFRPLTSAIGWALVVGCLAHYLWLLCGGPAGPAFLSAAIVPAVLVWELRRNRNATARLLAQVEDRRIVGPLTEALDYGDAVTRDAARRCLLRLLPQLTPADAFKLETRHRRRLNRALGSEDEPLILAVLQALPRIGDSSSVSPVQQLKKHTDLQQVKRAAMDCLPLLNMRVEELRISGTLLRPSSEADMAPEMLLRPVPFASDPEARDLLHTVFHEG